MRQRPDAPLVLGIETSCDDTSVAVVRDGSVELGLAGQTQIEPHARHGGIVPEAASRIHIEVIDAVLDSALTQAGVELRDIDAVAVTYGPGLPGSLLVGVEFAQALAMGLDLPIVPVNHLEGHFAAPWLRAEPSPEYPIVALIVSGGHTELIHSPAPGGYRLVGRTRDDAAGEAFDKIGRLLGLPFPGGPAIEEAARRVDSTPYYLPRAWIRGTRDFSFSGLKTAVLRLFEDRLGPAEAHRILGAAGSGAPRPGNPSFVADVSLAFELSVVDVLVAKTVDAAKRHSAASIIVTGGVSANRRLRQAMGDAAPVPVHVPEWRHCGDNAAMIAVAGAWGLARGQIAKAPVEIEPSLRLA